MRASSLAWPSSSQNSHHSVNCLLSRVTHILLPAISLGKTKSLRLVSDIGVRILLYACCCLLFCTAFSQGRRQIFPFSNKGDKLATEQALSSIHRLSGLTPQERFQLREENQIGDHIFLPPTSIVLAAVIFTG